MMRPSRFKAALILSGLLATLLAANGAQAHPWHLIGGSAAGPATAKNASASIVEKCQNILFIEAINTNVDTVTLRVAAQSVCLSLLPKTIEQRIFIYVNDVQVPGATCNGGFCRTNPFTVEVTGGNTVVRTGSLTTWDLSAPGTSWFAAEPLQCTIGSSTSVTCNAGADLVL